MMLYTGDDGKLSSLELQRKYGIGTMLSVGSSVGRPHHYELPVAIDNGAFSAYLRGYGFDEYAFLKLLSAVVKKDVRYDFLVLPDIVAGGKASLEFSYRWLERLTGWKRLYLAVQDGMGEDCYDSILSMGVDGIFVGGSQEWKWQTAHQWCEFAHTHGMKCHIGRCGTYERLVYAYKIGADSADSTNFVRNCRYDDVERYIDYIGCSNDFGYGCQLEMI